MRPTVLFHCQHSLGLGHLVRSFALAEALAGRFRVVVLMGGRVPEDVAVPAGVEVVPLAPVGMGLDGKLISLDGRRSAERALADRRGTILAAHERLRPEVVLVEMFPFGRKKFGVELVPLLEAAGDAGALRVCSVRDILVTGKRDQAGHDERASRTGNELFDLVLVHSDPRFARLEETFQPATPLRTPLRYTGFVAPPRGAGATPGRARPRPLVVVSAGGGLFGEELLAAAADAHRLELADAGIDVRLIGGPFLPEPALRRLRDAARDRPGLEVVRTVPDLFAELSAADASVSQCGYNTALDLLRARVPALVVPFAEGREDEQTRRAGRLEAMGALRVLPAARLEPRVLAAEIRGLLGFRPAEAGLALDGAAVSGEASAEAVAARAPEPEVVPA